MTDTDPTCAKCGHKRSEHHYRHPFEGPSAQDTIDAQAATIKALVEALGELADLMDDVRSGDYIPDSFTTQPARAAIAAAKETT